MQIAPISLSSINPVEKAAPMSAVTTVTEAISPNSKQFMSIGAEMNILEKLGFKGMYSIGGEAAVVGDIPQAFLTHYGKKGLDIWTFLPYHAPNNPLGQVIVAKIDKHLNGVTDGSFKYVPTDYELKEGEKFVVLAENISDCYVLDDNGQRIPTGELDKYGKPKYKQQKAHRYMELERTDVKGKIRGLKETKLEVQEEPYRLFKLADNITNNEGFTYRRAEHGTVAFMHTKGTAVMSKAYGGNAYMPGQVVGQWYNKYYAENCRAIADASEQMAKKEGYFPRNILLHDRTAFSYEAEVARRSSKGDKFNNLKKIHGVFHNPGPDYQGHSRDKLGSLRIFFDPDDFEKIKNLPDFQELRYLDLKRDKGLSAKENEQLNILFDKYFKNVEDEFGRINQSMTPVANVRLNGQQATAGTVSLNYGYEMKTCKDIALGMTKPLSEIVTHDITNGNNPNSMDVSKLVKLGMGENGLTEKIAEFQGYKLIKNESGSITNLSEILDAKKHNKKWLIDIIGSCLDKDGNIDQKSLNHVFFNNSQLFPAKKSEVPRSVMGCLSKYEPGDKLIISWGRPDPQKGFSTTMQSIYKFFKDAKNGDERCHMKFLFGAGGSAWDKSQPDYRVIKEYLKKIQELENGRFKNNVCYVDGLFPRELVACADWSIFSSRFEPCGLTPLESFATGTPVISIKTGGAPNFVVDYITNPDVSKGANGMLTKSPFMVDAKKLGIEKTDDIPEKVYKSMVDAARRENSSGELSELLRKVSKIDLDSDTYKKIAKNACESKTDWHQNAAYNIDRITGKQYGSAIKRYINEVFELDDNLNVKNTFLPSNMQKITGKLGETTINMSADIQPNSIVKKKKEVFETLSDTVQSGPSYFKRLLHDKRTYFVAAGVAAVAGIAIYALNRDKFSQPTFNVSKINNSKIYF